MAVQSSSSYLFGLLLIVVFFPHARSSQECVYEKPIKGAYGQSQPGYAMLSVISPVFADGKFVLCANQSESVTIGEQTSLLLYPM